jgi:uncharacterized protein (TIGR03437 family)
MRKLVIRALCCSTLCGIAALLLTSSKKLPGFALAQSNLQLVQVTSGLDSPVYITHSRDGSGRLFIIEQAGRILVLPQGASATLTTPFLDIRPKIVSGGEQGLLGMAFHPQYRTNGRFFVNYTRAGDGATVISEFKVSASDPTVAETDERILLIIPQPFANHNGGMLEFGPDGFLYIGTGDGGDGNDPGNRAQNINELLGKMLRIDVDNTNGATPYASPSSNPFFGATPGRDEIYAIGLRNPFRFSFDRATGQIYAGDVGQGLIEEIDIITLGGNFGWRVFEGTRCTGIDANLCNLTIYTPPITEYLHSGGRCSVTGGYVYRGLRGTFPAGTYIYADFCTGEIFRLNDATGVLLLDTDMLISSFGEDEAGEIYLLDLLGGVFRLAGPQPVSSVSAASYRGETVATESIVAAFGSGFAPTMELATPGREVPTVLAGTSVIVTDAKGIERAAPLFFVSPQQVNYQIPPGTEAGGATITVSNTNGAVSVGSANIASAAPGLFSADANGRGFAAAVMQRTRADGSQIVEPVVQFDQSLSRFVGIPIDLGPETDQVFVVLFGTGFRNRSALTAVTATIGGAPSTVTFAGAQGNFVGLDQANLLLPRSLAGRGEVEIVFNVDGQSANPVRIIVK